MPPSTTSASDRRSAWQDLTAATADLRHIKRLVQVHWQIMPELKMDDCTIQTEGTMNELNQSVVSRLQEILTERKSQFTKASKAYTEATGIPTDQSILYHPEPNHIPTPAESEDLLSELQEAQKRFLKAGTVVDDEVSESVYLAYEEVLSKDKFKPKA